MTQARSRVVITGVGMVTPLGATTEQSWNGLIEGRSGIGPITQFDTSDHSVSIAGEVSDFDPLVYLSKKDARKMDRFIQFAVAAAQMAVDDAQLPQPLQVPHRCGVLVGVGLGGLQTIEAALDVLRTKGPKRLSPFMLPRLISNLAPGQISIRFGAMGPNFSAVSACATGAHSIGEAVEVIRRGDADVMIAGGSEATITPLGIGGFAAMKALSRRNDDPTHASRPFDEDRDGFVAAEGAGVMVLETEEHARKRGARIYAEVIGYGQSSDAYHITLPQPEGLGAIAAMERALANAKLEPNTIDYLNAHGTSTPAGDPAETKAIRAVFGEHADSLWVSSTKSMTGHMLGAAGAVEAIICTLALANQCAPGTINLEKPSAECDLDYLADGSRSGALNACMSNSFGFGGTNVSLVIRRLNG